MGETVKSASVPAMRESAETDKPRQADYTTNVDMTRHSTEHHVGHDVNFNVDEKTDTDVSGRFDDRVNTLIGDKVESLVDAKIAAVMEEREARENERANRRNRNRLFTLAGAILIGIVVTYFFQNDGLPLLGIFHVMPKALAVTLYGYSFVVTVTLDAAFVAYSLWKHY